MDQALLAKIFSNIDKANVIQTCRDLIRIPAPVGKEFEKGQYIEKRLRELGLHVEVQEAAKKRNNIVGRLKGRGSGKTLMFHCHIDSVCLLRGMKSPYAGDIIDDKIYGKGAGDQMGAIAATIGMADAIVKSKVQLDGDIVFAYVVGELHALGTPFLLKKGIKADMCVIGEPSALDIGLAHGGIVEMEVRINGKPAHPSYKERAVHPVVSMAKLILELEKIPQEEPYFSKTHSLVGKPILYIGPIEGGTWEGTASPKLWAEDVPVETRFIPITACPLPEYCRMRFGMRTIPQERYGVVPTISTEELVAIVNKRIQKMKEANPLLEVEEPIVYWDENFPAAVSPDEPIVKVMQEAIEHVTHRKPKLTGFNYVIDQPFLLKAGIPTVNVGPTTGQASTFVECIPIKDLMDTTEIYCFAALEVCGLT